MNETLNKFEQNERFWAEQLFKIFPNIKEYQFTNGRICYDVIITLHNTKTILGEIKVRNIKIDKYDDYILEASKLVSLIKKYKKLNNDKIYYINFFNNEYEGIKDFIIFDLSARLADWKINKPIITKKWMNAETYKSRDNKIEKEVILLKYNDKIDCKGLLSLN